VEIPEVLAERDAPSASPVDATAPPIGSTDTTPATKAASPASGGDAVDPWAAILEAGAALLQGLAASRGADGAGSGARVPFAIERDPVTGQASVRLPLPDPAVLQRLAKALEPWLR
jgi:hypothetical protein